MQSNDWKNLNSIFSKKQVKKEEPMDEVNWDKIISMSLEERRMELLSEYDPNEEQQEMGKTFQETGRETQEEN